MKCDIYGEKGSLLYTGEWNSTFSIPEEILFSCGKILSVKTLVPIQDMTSVWHPDMISLPPMRLPWVESFSCGATKSFPLIVFLDQNSCCRTALGLTNMIDDCLVTAKMNQEKCAYEVEFRISIAEETERFDLFFLAPSPENPCSLKETLALYREKVMPQIPRYPAEAWNSVYCSWYAVHASLTDEYLRSSGEEAAKLGFGTFIVDDGWCFDEAKRVTPETLPDWYRNIGDWQYSGKKLPRLKETVREAQNLDLKYMFWVAPFFSGRKSALHTCVKTFLTEEEEGKRIFDPADPEIRERVKESIFHIFKEMDLDGLKIDFIDSITPDVDNPRCRIAFKMLKELLEKVKERKKNSLIEFRQGYATPLMAPLATAFRAGDVPFDYMENFARCVQIRLIMGDKIPVHADPVYFNEEESVEAVGRHMIASLAAVPMLSMPLSAMKKEHKKVVANYLAFYKEKQTLFKEGSWEFVLHNNFPSAISCTYKEEKVVIINDPLQWKNVLENVSGNATILNMTKEAFDYSCGKAFDAGNVFCSAKVPSGGRLCI